ncbi:MAG: hypothetical protein EXS58_12410 [Candidatus Latescibacteria bacterium]|nr:hypothetical protein [Candidatus Latescibacterota bacterium]
MLKLRSPAPAVLAVLLSGAMSFLSSGINQVWIAAWLAPIPLLLVLLELRPVPAALAAFATSAIGALSFVVAYRGLPPVLLVSVVLLFAVPFTLLALAWPCVPTLDETTRLV